MMDRHNHSVTGDADAVRTGSVRWEITDRGFKHYAPVETKHGNVVEVYESSAAFEPHLWVSVDGNTMHLTLEEVAAVRDQDDQDERLRETLAVAIERHYQLPQPDPKLWKAGDPCALCGSTDTWLEGDFCGCRSCGADERPDPSSSGPSDHSDGNVSIPGGDA